MHLQLTRWRFSDRATALWLITPGLLLGALFFYGFLGWTAWLSLTRSGMLPSHEFVGLLQYQRLFEDPRWLAALWNLLRFASLFVALPLLIGLGLAVLLDQKLRAEGVLRWIYLHPMALSMIVCGSAWRWLMDPDQGLAEGLRTLGWTSFRWDWLADEDMAVYALVVAAVWQISGFVMALFLAGLRGIDESLVQAARLDGASGWTLYRRVLLPQLGPSLFSALLILLPAAIKTFDLVVALTEGGPGQSSELPAFYMFQMAFERSRLGLGAASSMVMLMMVLAVALPYALARSRGEARRRAGA
ncbi:carbohydrate ABC transporter permease [Kinneretia aquatilis]|uniref:carbohydrate ABC transporter permease n=1 Tax=Kinneretia aquatilis TaxID=2070761 RepID=UPI0014952BC9|nr:sugar ABC transporter permease [Paucibacter aquatile]WIV98008.1 sugar ABC transporter permease [Paucibacter aquatile]